MKSKVFILGIIGILSAIPLSIVVPMTLLHYCPEIPFKIGVLIMGVFWVISLICMFLIDKEKMHNEE